MRCCRQNKQGGGGMKKGKKKEFILLVDEKDEFTIISIVGDLTLKEIQGMIQNE